MVVVVVVGVVVAVGVAVVVGGCGCGGSCCRGVMVRCVVRCLWCVCVFGWSLCWSVVWPLG